MIKKKSLLQNIYTEHSGENFIKKEDSWTSIIFSDPFSIPIARLAAKSKRLKPNHFTIISIIPVFFAVYFFFRGELIYGAFCYLLNFIIDGVDGKLARLTNQFSEKGAKLDYFFDRIGNIALYFTFWYSQYYIFGNWFIGGCFIIEHYALMLLGYLFIDKFKYKTIFPRVYSYYASLDEGFISFFFLPLLGIVQIGLPIMILSQSISYFILIIKQKGTPDYKTKFKKLIRLILPNYQKKN